MKLERLQFCAIYGVRPDKKGKSENGENLCGKRSEKVGKIHKETYQFLLYISLSRVKF